MPTRRGLFGKGLGIGGAVVGGWLAGKTVPPEPKVEPPAAKTFSREDVEQIAEEWLAARLPEPVSGYQMMQRMGGFPLNPPLYASDAPFFGTLATSMPWGMLATVAYLDHSSFQPFNSGLPDDIRISDVPQLPPGKT